MAGPYPSALFWVDIEATGVPSKEAPNDYSDVHILEIAFIVTDYDLKPYFGYQAVVQMNDKIKAALSKNPEVVKMHLENGLLKDSKESTDTLESIQDEIIEMLKTRSTQDKGEFLIAGSGVASYDFQMIKTHLPKVAAWLAYYPFDTGVTRRTMKILSGNKDLTKKITESFADGEKKHRAAADIKAHLKEAIEFQKFFRWAAAQQEAGNSHDSA